MKILLFAGAFVGAALAVAFAAWMLGVLGLTLYVDAECKARGFRRGNVTWNYKAYCTTTINQTDYVLPLDKAEPAPWVR